jgi:hypothetical protein
MIELMFILPGSGVSEYKVDNPDNNLLLKIEEGDFYENKD